MAKVSHGVETLPKISVASVGYMNVTDDRRQTDGRRYSEREREFTLKTANLFYCSFIAVVRRPTIKEPTIKQKCVLMQYLLVSTVCLKKHPRHFTCNFRKHCRIFKIFGTHVTEKESNQTLL